MSTMTTTVDKDVTLKDGTSVHIRAMAPEDVDRSLRFFLTLTPEERTYLRRDVTDRDVIVERVREIRDGSVKRIVATAGERIVADGSLEISGEGWKAHVGEIRLIVAPDHQRRGLGVLMARELYGMAAAAKVDEIVVRMMRPQKAARSIFKRIGFREEIVLPDWVRDQAGRKQDMILMRCNLKALWAELETFLAHGDWQRTR